MPTYDYHCEKCDQTYEVFQSMKDPHLKKCIQEGCKGKVTRLLGSGAGLVFKGSGFYITDYRSASYKAGQKQDSSSSSSSSASTPATPAPAAPAKPTGGNS
jgi:putative FmdB family regulatory protein